MFFSANSETTQKFGNDLYMLNLRNLSHFRQKSLKQRTRLNIQLTYYVDDIFHRLIMYLKRMSI